MPSVKDAIIMINDSWKQDFFLLAKRHQRSARLKPYY
jgi:hypothetical protein